MRAGTPALGLFSHAWCVLRQVMSFLVDVSASLTHSLIHSFTHSFSKHVWSVTSIPGSVLVIRNINK